MAYRQPFRSGLRDLAESLLRQADTMRQGKELEANLELQLGQLQAEQQRQTGALIGQTIQQVTGTVADFLGGEQQRKAQQAQDVMIAMRDSGERILKNIESDLTKANEDLTNLMAAGGNPREINLLRSVIADLNSMRNVQDLAQLPDLYQQFQGRTYGDMADRPSARERAIGREPQRLPGTGFRPSDVLLLGRANTALIGMADPSRARVNDAYVTGNVQGLNPRELDALRTWANVPEAQFNVWLEQRAAAHRQSVLDAEELASIQRQAAQTSLDIAGQTFRLNEFKVSQAEWEQRRRGILATWEDAQNEQGIIDGVVGAVANGDPRLLDMYIMAFRNPTSQLGVQLRSALGENGLSQLAQFRKEANDLYQLNRRLVQSDVQIREQNADLGLINLNRSRALDELQTAALRATYELDAAQAKVDLAQVQLKSASTALGVLNDIARVVPVSFWDNPPENIVEAMELYGMDVNNLRRISELEAWVREDPIRDDAWQKFTLLFKAPPTNEAAMMEMLAAAQEFVGNMGLSQIAQAGLLNSLMSAWAQSDEDKIAARGGLGALANGMSREDVNAMALMWSRLSGDVQQEMNNYLNQLAAERCALITTGSFIMPQIARMEDPNKIIASDTNAPPGSQRTCGSLFARNGELQGRLSEANWMQEYWVKQLNAFAGGPGVAPRGGGPQPMPSFSLPAGGGAAPASGGTPRPAGGGTTPAPSGTPAPAGGASSAPPASAAGQSVWDRLRGFLPGSRAQASGGTSPTVAPPTSPTVAPAPATVSPTEASSPAPVEQPQVESPRNGVNRDHPMFKAGYEIDFRIMPPERLQELETFVDLIISGQWEEVNRIAPELISIHGENFLDGMVQKLLETRGTQP